LKFSTSKPITFGEIGDGTLANPLGDIYQGAKSLLIDEFWRR